MQTDSIFIGGFRLKKIAVIEVDVLYQLVPLLGSQGKEQL